MNWKKTAMPLPMTRLARVAQAARGEQPLDDELVRSVGSHREEGAAEQAGPEVVVLAERERGIDEAELACGGAEVEDGAPSAGHKVSEEDGGRDSSTDIDGGLKNLRPDHGLHAAAVGIYDGEQPEDQDGRGHDEVLAHAGAEDEGDGDGGGENANGVGHGAGDHENDRGEAARRGSEAAVEQGVGGDQFALIVTGEECERDHDTAEDVSCRDLEEAEIAGEGETGDADERECAGFGGDDGEEDGPPGDGAIGDEVVFGVLLAAAHPDAQGRGSEEIDDDDGEIEEGEGGSHGGGRSPAARGRGVRLNEPQLWSPGCRDGKGETHGETRIAR